MYVCVCVCFGEVEARPCRRVVHICLRIAAPYQLGRNRDRQCQGKSHCLQTIYSRLKFYNVLHSQSLTGISRSTFSASNVEDLEEEGEEVDGMVVGEKEELPLFREPLATLLALPRCALSASRL